MSEATLAPDGDGRWVLGGTLDFATVPDIWPQLERELKTVRALEISLARVERSNSAALAMLVEARDLARERGVRLSLVDLPAGLLELAQISSAESLIGGVGARRVKLKTRRKSRRR